MYGQESLTARTLTTAATPMTAVSITIAILGEETTFVNLQGSASVPVNTNVAPIWNAPTRMNASTTRAHVAAMMIIVLLILFVRTVNASVLTSAAATAIVLLNPRNVRAISA